MRDDNSFSPFMFGLTLGIIGTLLLSTEEGRRVSKTLFKSVSEGIEKNEDLFLEAKNAARQAVHEIQNQFKEPPSYLPDQPANAGEAPPPPPPYISRPRPDPAYFQKPNEAPWS